MNKLIQNHDTDGDLLRIIAAFFVVLIHTAASASFSAWSVFYNSLARFSVPVFIILSGRYMLAKQRSLKSIFIKSAELLLLMLIWSAVYYFYELHSGTQEYRGIGGVITYLLTQPIHLWYVYTAVGLYLLTPLFYVFCENADRQLMQYALGLTFLLGSVVTLALRTEQVPLLGAIVDKFHMDCTLGFVFCYLLGDYLRRYEVQCRIPVYAAGLLGTAVTFIGTLWLSRSEGNFLLYSFFAPNVLAASAALYIGVCQFVLHRPIKSRCVRETAAQLASCTLGVYLLHPLILSLLSDYVPIQLISAVDIPVRTICAFALSVGCIFIIRNIPFLRRVAG